MKLPRPLVVFDLETTGTWIEKDRIVEIGIIKLLPDGSKENYVKRINPGISIPPNVSRITGITDDDVKDAPGFKDLAKEVLEFIGESDIGGFNILRFDLPILEREFFEAGISFPWRERNIYDAQIKKYGADEQGIESLKNFDYEQSSAYFDKGRKFCWWNGQLYPTFGKYGKKKHIKDIVKNDRPYLNWVLTKDFSEEVKIMIKKTLDGDFPQAP